MIAAGLSGTIAAQLDDGWSYFAVVYIIAVLASFFVHYPLASYRSLDRDVDELPDARVSARGQDRAPPV
jgi:hypothetical protein